jgi:hypothetical protein
MVARPYAARRRPRAVNKPPMGQRTSSAVDPLMNPS